MTESYRPPGLVIFIIGLIFAGIAGLSFMGVVWCMYNDHRVLFFLLFLGAWFFGCLAKIMWEEAAGIGGPI